jgi:hypothetical protein
LAGFAFEVFTAVLVLEVLDREETLDLSSLDLAGDRRTSELRELRLDPTSDSSRTCDIFDEVAFLCCENSVSGGLGGLAFFSAAAFFGESLLLLDDLVLLLLAPMSVGSGVRTFRRGLLLTASLLCAFEKLG